MILPRPEIGPLEYLASLASRVSYAFSSLKHPSLEMDALGNAWFQPVCFAPEPLPRAYGPKAIFNQKRCYLSVRAALEDAHTRAKQRVDRYVRYPWYLNQAAANR
jgi:hypothetical protein